MNWSWSRWKLSCFFSICWSVGIKPFAFSRDIEADSVLTCILCNCTDSNKTKQGACLGRERCGCWVMQYLGSFFPCHSAYSWEGYSLTQFLSESLWTQDVSSFWSGEKTSALLLQLLTLPFIGMNRDYLDSSSKWCAVNPSGQIGRDY